VYSKKKIKHIIKEEHDQIVKEEARRLLNEQAWLRYLNPRNWFKPDVLLPRAPKTAPTRYPGLPPPPAGARLGPAVSILPPRGSPAQIAAARAAGLDPKVFDVENISVTDPYDLALKQLTDKEILLDFITTPGGGLHPPVRSDYWRYTTGPETVTRGGSDKPGKDVGKIRTQLGPRQLQDIKTKSTYHPRQKIHPPGHRLAGVPDWSAGGHQRSFEDLERTRIPTGITIPGAGALFSRIPALEKTAVSAEGISDRMHRTVQSIADRMKESWRESYVSGPKRHAWLDAGVPLEVYEDLVMPHIINKLNNLKVTFKDLQKAGDDFPSAGLYHHPTTEQPHGAISVDPGPITPYGYLQKAHVVGQGRRSLRTTLAHEWGHAFSFDPFLAAIFNRYTTPMTRQSKRLVYKGYGNLPRNIKPEDWEHFKLQRQGTGVGPLHSRAGIDKMQLHGREHKPSEGHVISGHGAPDWSPGPYSFYEPMSTELTAAELKAGGRPIAQTSMAKLQAEDLRKLFDDTMNVGNTIGFSNPSRRWLATHTEMTQGGRHEPLRSLDPKDIEDVEGIMKWWRQPEERYADVMSVSEALGRRMEAQDIRDIILGVDSYGARAINSNTNFRDFLTVRVPPEETAYRFNKLVEWLAFGAVGAGAAAGGENLQENKSLTIVGEEAQRLLSEQAWLRYLNPRNWFQPTARPIKPPVKLPLTTPPKIPKGPGPVSTLQAPSEIVANMPKVDPSVFNVGEYANLPSTPGVYSPEELESMLGIPLTKRPQKITHDPIKPPRGMTEFAETPVLKPYQGNTPEQTKLVNDLKNRIVANYVSGPSKKAWLAAGVPTDVYEELVIPRIINKLNVTPIKFTNVPPPNYHKTKDWFAGGDAGAYSRLDQIIYINTNKHDPHHGFLENPWLKHSLIGGEYPAQDPWHILAHETGHGFSWDPYLAAIFNRYKLPYSEKFPNRPSGMLDPGGPPERFEADRSLKAGSGIPKRRLRSLKFHGRDIGPRQAEQLHQNVPGSVVQPYGPTQYPGRHPRAGHAFHKDTADPISTVPRVTFDTEGPLPSEYFLGSAYAPEMRLGIPVTSTALMQPLELDALIGPYGNRIGDLKGFLWYHPGNLPSDPAEIIKLGIRPGEDVKNINASMRGFEAWRRNHEEISADVFSIRTKLGREMEAQDIIDVVTDVDSLGARAINSVPSLRDFLPYENPENTARAFNKIVQALLTMGAGGAALQGQGEELKENKSLIIVEEEFQKLLSKVEPK